MIVCATITCHLNNNSRIERDSLQKSLREFVEAPGRNPSRYNAEKSERRLVQIERSERGGEEWLNETDRKW